MAEPGVRFIRVRGRIVPIRDKAASAAGAAGRRVKSSAGAAANTAKAVGAAAAS